MSRVATVFAAILGLVALPPVLAVGFGWWNRAAAIQQAFALGAFSYLSELVEASRTANHPAIGVIAVLLCTTVTFLVARSRGRIPVFATRLWLVVEIPVLGLGLFASVGVLAVAMAIDRPVFWGGLLACAAVGVREEPRAEVTPFARAGAVAWAAMAILLAGITLLEGPGLHSPAFRLGEWWLSGPGARTVVAGGIWLVFGAFMVAAAQTHGGIGRRGRPALGAARLVAALLGLMVALVGTVVQAPTSALATVGILSVLGALGGAMAWAHRIGFRVGRPGSLFDVLDPRRVIQTLLPLLLFGALCAGRGMLVHMFTAPSALPPGVERLSLRTGIFALHTEQDGDLVYFTDRTRTEFGVLDPAGPKSRSWSLHAAGADAVEELGGPVIDGRIWVSAGRWSPEPTMGLMPIDLDTGPGDYRAVSGCWIASWIPMPEAAVERLRGGRSGDVLLGCESDAAVYVFRPSEGRMIARIALPDDVEAGVFHRDGGSLYGISLWGDPSVSRYAFPSGERLATAPVGPFNWALAFDGRDRLWASRFFEGAAMIFDPDTLRPVGRVPLSFGVRAMIHDPVRGRIWASAAYSGRIWEVETEPPYRRRVYALCGQARDLQADGRGRVVVATDCGIFRIDPTVEQG